MAEQPIAPRVNYGDAEDYYRGFNRGYDDYPDIDAPDEQLVPKDEPRASTYRRGWEHGFVTAAEHDQEEDDFYG